MKHYHIQNPHQGFQSLVKKKGWKRKRAEDKKKEVLG
jgi:hypothetical protein